MQATVIPTYTSHSALAVEAMRGVSFESFIGPGVSALKSCMPPTPSSGSTATVSTMMPIPPIQCRRWRQRLIEGARSSRPLITVEPVVVRPEAASKNASVKDMPRPSSISGSAPTAGSSGPGEHDQHDAVADAHLAPEPAGREPERRVRRRSTPRRW